VNTGRKALVARSRIVEDRCGALLVLTLVRLAVDFEFTSRTWWDEGGDDLWQGIAEGFDGSSVVVDEPLANSWLEQAQRILGWEDGPDYAPHPVRASPVDDDEDV
jgi:hypothetical protein